MSARDWAGEYHALTDEIKRTATADSFDAQAIHKRNTYAMTHFPAVLDALDDAECEIERQRGDLVIERRRAEAAEAALDRVRKLVQDEDGEWLPYWRATTDEIRAALDGTS
ncbi:hypothetical protein [Rhodococcus phenolicus]|uniref:hypothetical protein n=1 Tax=Rhodococcus phenolicus TaxID=263849 RepID=UPI0008316A52|nr:hypothetical protein [Rhodococcus phenolicus]